MDRFFIRHMKFESPDGMIFTGKSEELVEKPVPVTLFSTTNHTWNEPGANPGFRGMTPSTNRLSYGTALLKAD
jgi:hypothetical protein